MERLLEQFHIKELENSYTVRISGGQQQRAALARMMAAEPKFLLLDEPFSALDAYLKEKLMQEMMTYLNQFKKGVIMVSHSRDEVYQMCSDTVIMHQGMIETLGKTKEIFDKIVENLQTIVNNGDYEKFLKFQKNFRDYSFNNLILIFSQFPDATKVAR